MPSPVHTFWPTAHQFAEALQCPSLCFADPALKAMIPAVDRLGMPLVTSGQFAYVFKLNSADGDASESLAVRCFRSYLGDREERYRALDAHLGAHRVGALPRFKYLPRGLLVGGAHYPALVMEWVDGPTLDVYLDEVVGRTEVLRHLADEWLGLMSELRAARVAHGDLQHGNIIVERGRLRLVDLDGMFVPALDGARAIEVGHRHYQHPSRDPRLFSDATDNFSALVIYLSLVALAERPKLWREHHDENLLFSRQDFVAPESSALFAKIGEAGPLQARLAGVLREAARSDPAATPWLLDLVSAKARLPVWMEAPAGARVEARTREVERSEVARAEPAGVRTSRRAERAVPRTPASSSVQGLFSAMPAAALAAPAPPDPADVRANTLMYAKKLFGGTYFYLWWIPIHNMILEHVWSLFGVAEGPAILLTLIFIAALFFLYGFARAVHLAETAVKGGGVAVGAAAAATTTIPSSSVSSAAAPLAAGGAPRPRSLFANGPYAAPPQAGGGDPVVGNQSLGIYHQPGCEWVDKISRRHRLDFDSPASAQTAGHRPCQVCTP